MFLKLKYANVPLFSNFLSGEHQAFVLSVEPAV